MTDQTPDTDPVATAAAAIDAALRDLTRAVADHHGDDPGLLTDWITVSVSRVEDGTRWGSEAYTVWGSDHTPLHSRLGLLEYGLHRARGHIGGCDDA